jgi:hypothetical protein
MVMTEKMRLEIELLDSLLSDNNISDNEKIKIAKQIIDRISK